VFADSNVKWVISRNSLYIKLFRLAWWILDPEPENLNLCKLFWGTVFAWIGILLTLSLGLLVLMCAPFILFSESRIWNAIVRKTPKGIKFIAGNLIWVFPVTLTVVNVILIIIAVGLVPFLVGTVAVLVTVIAGVLLIGAICEAYDRRSWRKEELRDLKKERKDTTEVRRAGPFVVLHQGYRSFKQKTCHIVKVV